MKKKFVLKKGEISFNEDHISINDNSKKEIRNSFIISSLFIIYGTTLIIKYTKNGDSFMLWPGILIVVGHLWLFIRTLHRSSNEIIKLEDVESLKIESQFTKDFLVIKHNNEKYRLIGDIDFPKEIDLFITEYKTHYNLPF